MTQQQFVRNKFLIIVATACCGLNCLNAQHTNRSVVTHYSVGLTTGWVVGDVVIFTQKVNQKEETAPSQTDLEQRRNGRQLLPADGEWLYWN